MSRDGIAEPRSPDGAVEVWRVEARGRAAARSALLDVLALYLGGGERVELLVGPDGKPRLAGGAGRLSFNLSHSGGLALVAVAEVEVGVDVELVKPRRDLMRLAERRLPGAEAEALNAVPEPEREAAFYRAWTRHEARVKCTGAGLAGPPPGPEVVAHGLAIDEGYVAAVATALAEPRITVENLAD